MKINRERKPAVLQTIFCGEYLSKTKKNKLMLVLMTGLKKVTQICPRVLEIISQKFQFMGGKHARRTLQKSLLLCNTSYLGHKCSSIQPATQISSDLTTLIINPGISSKYIQNNRPLMVTQWLFILHPFTLFQALF